MSAGCAQKVATDVGKSLVQSNNGIPNDHTEQEQEKAAEYDREHSTNTPDRDDFKDMG